MSDLADAFKELREEFDRTTGEENKVQIGTKKYPAIIEDADYDEIVVAGGEGDNGGFRCLIGTDVLPKRPAQRTEITARGRTLSILTVTNTNGAVWTIVAGDPATE